MAEEDPTTEGAGEPDSPQRFYGFDEDTSAVAVPAELPILPLRGVVIFPSAIVPLLISRGASLKLVEAALTGDRMLGLLAQKNPEEESPEPRGLYSRGTAGRILKMLRYPDGSVRILVQGLRRIEVGEYTQREPYFRAHVRHLEDVSEPSKELEALQVHMVHQFSKFVSMIPYLPDELQVVVMNIKDPGKVTDLIASNLNISLEEKQDLLSTLDVRVRLEKLSTILNREIELLELGQKIQSQVQSELNKNQKEFYLRQQLKAIQKELGEGDGRTAEIEDLRRRVDEARMPPEALKAAERELDRLRMIPPESAEHTVVRTYLEWLVSLPWSVSTEDNLDLHHARQVLDEDHFDLEKIKDRILEYLAVRKLRQDPRSPILCFVGPPGVGKTSLGKSIARATGREFVRMSLGGVRDEAEIRGHRRTYIGSMPGKVIQSMRKAKKTNPLFLFDEIDKMGADFRGDPASALLEVLDPEQNHTFNDHYLEVDYDLSNVMFVTTANTLNIPPALMDRMEIIRIAGYTELEKIEIARRHLIPAQTKAHGLEAEEWALDDDALKEIIRRYTREAGVRSLERELAKLARKSVKELLTTKKKNVTITLKNIEDYLGVPKYRYGEAELEDQVGVVTGLAWTEVGGEILTVEGVMMPGKGKMTVTGNLRDVMKESIQAANAYVRSRSVEFGIEPPLFERRDIHVHVPEGATPKDGPSAGVAMVTAIVSLMTGIPVRREVAMTGEITLRGRVLPIGGLKEKLLAALRAGIKTVIIPDENAKDLTEIPDELKKVLDIRTVSRMDEVVKIAFTRPPQPIIWEDDSKSREIATPKDETPAGITAH